MPIRLCLEPRCGSEATWRGRCPVHRTQRNRETRSKNARYYNSKRWAMLRRKKLRLNPICERCDRVLANEVHHRVDIQDGGDPWSMANLESCCKPCHSRITRRTQVESTRQ